MPEGIPVFLDGVECVGSESGLSDCMDTTATNECTSAGVTCEKGSSEIMQIMWSLPNSVFPGPEKCMDAGSTQSLDKGIYYERYV